MGDAVDVDADLVTQVICPEAAGKLGTGKDDDVLGCWGPGLVSTRVDRRVIGEMVLN